MNKILCFILLSYSAWGFSQTGLPQNIIIDGSYGINSPQEMKLNDLNNDDYSEIKLNQKGDKHFQFEFNRSIPCS